MNKKLTTAEFTFSLVLLLICGLFVLGVLYFVLYIDTSNNPNRSYFKTGPITKKPATLMLELNNPDNDLLVFNKELEISGKTIPNSYVLVTNMSDDIVIKSRSDGSFSGEFELSDGVNEIKIISFDQNGEQKEIERTVYYSKEKI